MSSILEPGTEPGVAVVTKAGRSIPTRRRKPRPKDAMKAAEKACRSVGAGVETRSLDATYNCVGMVFAFRRASIETDHVHVMLDDDGYREVTKAAAFPGDLVVYYYGDSEKPSHVGVILSKTPRVDIADFHIRVVSQWGFDGEYLHDEATVPLLYGTRRRYFSERVCL